MPRTGPIKTAARFRYAIATGRASRDPSVDLRGALPPAKHEHFASITEPAKVGELLRAIDAFQGTFVVQCALRLALAWMAFLAVLREVSYRLGLAKQLVCVTAFVL